MAFKAYDGSEDYTPEQLSGALFIVDGIEAMKGTFRLLESLIKALSRRKR